MSSRSMVVKTPAAHTVDKATGLIIEDEFAQNFVSVQLEMQGTILRAKRVADPLIQTNRHNKIELLDRGGVEQYLLETEVLFEEYGKLANSAHNIFGMWLEKRVTDVLGIKAVVVDHELFFIAMWFGHQRGRGPPKIGADSSNAQFNALVNPYMKKF